jgi:glyoxylase-like metal-dependent hydrolase (beta-lactamase superfamily II)
MLKQVANGVWIHNSEFLESKSIVVQGKAGVLLIDPGITSSELADLAKDLRELGHSVVAGFSTHPHWDHVLWHTEFGDVPRYGTAQCATSMQDLLTKANWKDLVTGALPPDIGDQIPLDKLFGKLTGLQVETKQIPWDGPVIRIIEHQGHAEGHAALFIEDSGILVAGDMLSDSLIPFLNLDAADPIKDYLAGLELFAYIASDVTFFIPGHGSVGDITQLHSQIELDRAYIQALRDGGGSDDPRLLAGPNKQWLPSVHAWQSQKITKSLE